MDNFTEIRIFVNHKKQIRLRKAENSETDTSTRIPTSVSRNCSAPR